jgi:hypothetical protein
VIAWCERSNSFEIFVNDKKSPAHCDHSAVMLQEAKAKAKATKEAKAVVSWQTTMASKVADMLHSIVDRALDKPPAATPGHCYSQLVPSALPSVAHMMMMI